MGTKTVRVTDEMYEWLRHKAFHSRQSIQSIVEEAIKAAQSTGDTKCLPCGQSTME